MSDAESETRDDKDEFKDAVQEWVSIHDKLAEIRKSIAAHNKRKRKLSEFIVHFMKKNNLEFCKLGSENGSLELKHRKSKMALKQEHVEKLLLEFLRDPSSAKEGAEFLFNNKEVKEVAFIKRSGSLE